jgi:hypothetical protein
MKQYNIPNGGYVPVDNIIYFMENDISQVNRIPLLQNYDGYAIVTIGPIYLDKEIDLESIVLDDEIVCDDDEKIFIMNCSHDNFKNNVNAFSQTLNKKGIKHVGILIDYFTEKQIDDESI